MQQIKVKELPKDYFVTDTYYPSGNVEFKTPESVGIGTVYKAGNYDNPIVKELFGKVYKKHIQLIAANPTFIEDAMDGFETDYYFSLNRFWLEVVSEIEKLVIEITKKQYEEWTKLKKPGKDVFLYKVSEEK